MNMGSAGEGWLWFTARCVNTEENVLHAGCVAAPRLCTFEFYALDFAASRQTEHQEAD